MLEVADSTEPCVYYAFSCTHTPVKKLNLEIGHSKLVTITNNKIEQLQQQNKGYLNTGTDPMTVDLITNMAAK